MSDKIQNKIQMKKKFYMGTNSTGYELYSLLQSSNTRGSINVCHVYKKKKEQTKTCQRIYDEKVVSMKPTKDTLHCMLPLYLLGVLIQPRQGQHSCFWLKCSKDTCKLI